MHDACSTAITNLFPLTGGTKQGNYVTIPTAIQHYIGVHESWLMQKAKTNKETSSMD